jgi:hypothetical protein
MNPLSRKVTGVCGQASPVATFTSSYFYDHPVGGNSITYNNCGIGTAAADRWVIVGVITQRLGPIVSVSIGGTAVTADAYFQNGSSSTDNAIGVYKRLIPTGTTTSVQVVGTGSAPTGPNFSYIALYSVTRLSLNNAIKADLLSGVTGSSSIVAKPNAAALFFGYTGSTQPTVTGMTLDKYETGFSTSPVAINPLILSGTSTGWSKSMSVSSSHAGFFVTYR